jgi:hypothetical protein
MSQVKQVKEATYRRTLIVRGIWYLEGVLMVLLGFRFIFALLGANPLNPFAHFIYGVTLPLVAPFVTLFGYRVVYTGTRFEAFTLVTMAVYLLIGWGLVRLVLIGRMDRD